MMQRHEALERRPNSPIKLRRGGSAIAAQDNGEKAAARSNYGEGAAARDNGEEAAAQSDNGDKAAARSCCLLLIVHNYDWAAALSSLSRSSD